MKYESELIKEIVGSRGHEKSSLHYESECIESWIEEDKGAYPKLCDYQSEWLNYIIELNGGGSGGGEEPEPEEPPIGQFPYETVTTNHTAMVNHVVPFAYKTAILKGQTLVNLFNFNNEKNLVNCKIEFLDNQVVITGGGYASIHIPLKKSTTYTLFAKSRTRGRIIFIQDYTNADSRWIGTFTNAEELTIYKFNTFDVDSNYGIMFYSLDGGVIYDDVMVLEGDYTNVDIPYFEGVQSVQMPVLTTSNTEFLTTLPISFFEENKPVSNSGWANFKLPRTLNDVTIKCKINGLNQLRLNYNKSITIANNDLKNGIEIKVDSLTDIAFHGDGILHETKGNLIMWLKDGSIELGINEKGSELVDGYKIPYESNILTVNEDIELKSFEDLRDELNLLTGEMTQRVEKIVLDGKEDGWIFDGTRGSRTAICYIGDYFATPPTNAITNYFSLIVNKDNGFWNSGKDNESFCVNDKSLAFRIEKTKLKTLDSNGIKEWLSQNNLIIQYDLATPIVKTVDLTVVNQDGKPLSKIKPIEGTMHVEVSGTPINPTAVLEVPVEAITQNLNSFIEEE